MNPQNRIKSLEMGEAQNIRTQLVPVSWSVQLHQISPALLWKEGELREAASQMFSISNCSECTAAALHVIGHHAGDLLEVY